MNARTPTSLRLSIVALAVTGLLAACAQDMETHRPTDPADEPAYGESTAPLTFVAPAGAGDTDGLVGEYYDTANFTSHMFTRVDPSVDFTFGNGSPDPSMGSNTFSIRWSGYLTPPATTSYRFQLCSDDGSQLVIDGLRVVDNWGDHRVQCRDGVRNLTTGRAYRFEIEYYDGGGPAEVHLTVSVNGGPFIAVPPSWFSYGGSGTGLRAKWWNSRASMDAGDAPAATTLKRSPVFADYAVTLPPEVSDGEDPPAGVAADQFAATVSGYLEAPLTGTYEFAIECSGPYYIWIDTTSSDGGRYQVDRWSAPPTGYQTIRATLVAGTRTPFHLDYQDIAGDSTCRVGWRPPGYIGPADEYEYIPSLNFYPAEFGTGSGLTARYYDNSDFTNQVATRVDPVVNFDWNAGAPALGGGLAMGSDTFSIEWSGELEPLFTEQHTFYATHDDGVRVWIDNVLVINRWTTGAYESSGRINLTKGQRVPIRVQYFDDRWDAQMSLAWSSNSQFRQIVPTSQLYPEVADTSGGTGLEAFYFNDTGLTAYFASRIDPIINFNWGTASPLPGTGMNSNHFGVRWVGQVRPRYSETYTFETWTDDGVRLWVNDVQLIEDWQDQTATQNTGTITLIAGKRYDIKMEYYDSTGTASARLLWSSPSQASEVIPQSRLFPPPALGVGTGLLGTYHGRPNLDPTDLRLVKVDDQIAFSDPAAPPNPVLPPGDYSIQWAGSIESVYDEDYTLTLRHDGAVRLYFDNILVIDQWVDAGTSIVEHSVTLPMETGQLYDIRIEYGQDDVGGTIEFYWESDSQVRQLVPRRQLYPADPAIDVELGQCESVIKIEDFAPEAGEEVPEGLEVNPDGSLTLYGATIRSPDIWVANPGNSTITRINTNDGTRIATYPSALDPDMGWDPSRTTVDLNYDAWVANRAFPYWQETNGVEGIQVDGTDPDTYVTRMGTVTKITQNCACPDPNTDLCTECIDFTVPMGLNTIPRGLAIDGQNNVWVGLWQTQQLVKLDNATGAVLETHSVPVRPYGLAIDRVGRIWIAANGGGVACFDTITRSGCGLFSDAGGLVHGEGENCMSPYGIAVDLDMNVWFGNQACDGIGRLDNASYEASVFANTDPLTGTTVWDNVTMRVDFYNHPTDTQRTRGIAVDGTGRVWVASSSSHRLLQFDPITTTWIGSYGASNGPIGVGISDRGSGLAVAAGSSLNTYGYGEVYSYSPEGQLEWHNYTGPSSYSYSDMTGFQLRTFTAPIGTWNRVIDCSTVSTDGCVFDYMSWDADIPEGSVVQVRFRTGDTDPTTGETIWDDWSASYSTSPSPLGRDGYQGDFVEVEVTLIAAPEGYAPLLRTVQFWRCPQIYPPINVDVDRRTIISASDRNYAIAWKLTDDSWPETRWEFIDVDGNMRCLLDSTTSITKGQTYSGIGQYPACEERHFLSNTPVTRSARTAYWDPELTEWKRSVPTSYFTYYTLVNDPTSANGDMRIIGQTGTSVFLNWCRPLNNWESGLTGARVARWTGTIDAPDPGSYTILADFPAVPAATGTARGYASPTNNCGTIEDTGLALGTGYFYRLEYQNGDGILSAPLTLWIETWGAPCCNTLALGCGGVCGAAVTGPTGCELPPVYEVTELTCDGLDNDCDGFTDEGLLNACGYCGPEPPELCDGFDNDCDGTIDQNPVAGPTHYWDADSDTWGDDGIQSIRCAPGDGWVARGGDCDETNPAVNPGAEEQCDGIDNDCDTLVDESGAFVPYYADSDGDTFGNPGASTMSCAAPDGYVFDNTDCDDTRASVHPGAEEICDGRDNDCNGIVDDGWARIGFQIFQTGTTAQFGASACQNAYDGLACEGSVAVEFEVSNPSEFWVPTGVEVDFRFDGPTGTRITAPIPLVRPVAPYMSETFLYCFPTSYAGTRDLWGGLHNVETQLHACGVPTDVDPDAVFSGGPEICDGLDNDCNDLVDDDACGVTQVCVETTTPGTYRCVGAITEEGACDGGACVVECETDDQCADDAECRSGACVESRWLTDDDAAPPAADAPPAAAPEGVDSSSGSSQPGETGCTTAAGGRGTSAGWAGTLLALMLVRRRRCRGARQT